MENKTATNILTFEKRQVNHLLEGLSVKVNAKGEIIKDGKVAECPVCQSKLTKNNLGNILTGSMVLVCDNPSCFAKYISQKGF